MVGIAQVESADAGDVGRNSHLVVRDAHGSPHAAHFLGSFAKDLEQPGFVFVCNGEALTAVTVAIFLDQLAHQADGVTGSSATLQGNARQLLNHEDAILVAQGVTTRNGCLAHGQLLLVEAGIGGVEETVGVAHLGNHAQTRHVSAVFGRHGVETVLIDGGDRITFVITGRHHFHPGAVTCITGVGGDDRAIGTGPLAHHDAGTGFGHALSVLSVDCHGKCHHKDGGKD